MSVTERAFNEVVRDVAALRVLDNPRGRGGGTPRHHWQVSASFEDEVGDFGINPLSGERYFSAAIFDHSKMPRFLKVRVSPGCVNEKIATMLYLAKDDLRGWTPPIGHQGIFGSPSGSSFVDRDLTEQASPPALLLTVPNADATELGGFVEVGDKARPAVYRTAAMWKRKLYRAHVLLTVQPFRSDPLSVLFRTGGAVPAKWRVHAGKLPRVIDGAGIAALAFKELARIYLARVPGRPELDRVEVEQKCFWSLGAKSATPGLALLEAALEATVGLDLAVLGLGLTGITVGLGLLAIEGAVIDISLDNFEAIMASASLYSFWTAV